ncbi:MAG: hypothetical protein OXC63_00690 [Aestuariivita sp.]|nr:hypothetical protein [Aestuariivita sp.]
MQDIHIGRLAQSGCRVERIERLFDVLNRVMEVEDEGLFLAQFPVRPVKPR